MTAGMIIAASVIVARALQPVEQVIANWRNMVAARQAWLRLKALLALFPESGHRTALPAPADTLAVEAVFVAPSGEKQRMAVQNVTFRARSGTAIIKGTEGNDTLPGTPSRRRNLWLRR